MSYFLINFAGCVETVCISVFAPRLIFAFDCSLFEVNFASSCGTAVFLPSFIITVWLYNTFSVRTVLIIAVVLLFVGAWIRMVAMVNDQFLWIVIGQCIIQTNGPMTTGAISIIANYWFGDKERGRATSIMALSSPFGMLVSFFIQAAYSYRIEQQFPYIAPPPPPSTQENEVVRANIYNLLFVENCMITVAVVYFFVVFNQSKPPSPPSPSATRRT